MTDYAGAAAEPNFISQLPEVARTRSGIEFDPRQDRWAFRDELILVRLDFSLISRVTRHLIEALKSTLLWYAENQSGGSLNTAFGVVRRFLNAPGMNRKAPVAIIRSIDLLNYRAGLTRRQAWYLSYLSSILRKWHELGLPGVSDEAVALLNQWTLKGGEKGRAVLTMDPIHGPLTDLELQAIQSALNAAYLAGGVSTGAFLLAWLFMLLGQRPVQYAALKVCDVIVGNSQDGSRTYCLRVPRAKQRYQMMRAEFKERVLAPQIGRMLSEYADRVKSQFAGVLLDPTLAPLFPGEPRSPVPSGFEYHRTAACIGELLEWTLKGLRVTSERTGRPIHIHPTRFRRTLGTRAAIEGHGELVIAELLDHTDTQHAGIYVHAVPKIIERIDKAVAMRMAPLAQAFAGVLIKDQSEASRGDDPASRIVDPRFCRDMKPMGNCGQHGFCGLLAPIACYTCSRFQPWLDGPHEAVLDHLVAERERLLANTDTRIASVNDHTILAVAEVVRRCQEHRDRTTCVAHG